MHSLRCGCRLFRVLGCVELGEKPENCLVLSSFTGIGILHRGTYSLPAAMKHRKNAHRSGPLAGIRNDAQREVALSYRTGTALLANTHAHAHAHSLVTLTLPPTASVYVCVCVCV
jgi:hypothetical protein